MKNSDYSGDSKQINKPKFSFVSIAAIKREENKVNNLSVRKFNTCFLIKNFHD